MAIEHGTMPKTGVEKLHYFKVIQDSAKGIRYGEAVAVGGSVKIAFSIDTNIETLFADNIAYARHMATGELTVQIEGADFTPAMIADWEGSEYENGLLRFSEAHSGYFCVAWRFKKSDASYRYVRVQKGMFSVPAQQGQSAVSGNIHYQTADVTFSGFQTNYDKNSFAILDDDDPNLPEGITKEDIEENWFKDPTWMPEEKDTV